MHILEPSPQVSVILVTWNSGEYLPRCLDCLEAQTLKNFEIVLVDNGSKDGSLEGLKAKHPGLALRLERLSENRGFAAANNIGARLAHAPWLALLNADAFPEPNWLKMLLQAAEQNPKFSFFACRQIKTDKPELLDGAGDAYHVSGLAWRQLEGWPVDRFGLEMVEVFSACAAAALYSRQAFFQAGGFDEDFFSYFEDVDLSFRMRLQGFRCLYVPQASVLHIGSASTGRVSPFAIYHGHRNLVWSYIKNMPATLFWLYLPLHLLMNIFFLLSFSLQGQPGAIWRAKRDAFRRLGSMFRKRNEIQSQRKVSSVELYRQMEQNWLAPLIIKVKRRSFETNS
jgi:GT2 family glycosyltransferase